MAMLEARVRIATNNTQTPVFSPQDVVSCSEYAQGVYAGLRTFSNSFELFDLLSLKTLCELNVIGSEEFSAL